MIDFEVERRNLLEAVAHQAQQILDLSTQITRLREDRASAIDRLTPLGLENGRLQQRCWALALLLYPSGEAREAVEGDI